MCVEAMFMIFMLIEGTDIVKKNAESSVRAGEKSPKSEDDVFSDAVMDFSDGVISPQLEEHAKSVSELGLGKSLEQKSSDLNGSGALEVEEAAGKDAKDLVLCLE